MKNSIIILLVTMFVLSCKQDTSTSYEVTYSGNLSDVMGGKLDATMSLTDLKDLKNLYALGVIDNLNGEIQVFNSEPILSRRGADDINMSRNFQAKAALVVYAQVAEWQEIEIPKAILTMKQFEPFLEGNAKKAGLDTSKPFPFMIEGYVRKLNWHIVKRGTGNQQQSHMDHMKTGLSGVTVEEKTNIIGFYSNAHQGIFTHHDSKVHMHFKSENGSIAGHVDDLLLGEYMTLKLPKQ